MSVKMHTDAKQNNKQGEHRRSKRSTSACKSILKSMVNQPHEFLDNSMSIYKPNRRNIDKINMTNTVKNNTDRGSQSDQIAKFKLEQSIKFLNKKIERQDEQILHITGVLEEQKNKNQSLNRMLATEKQKTRRVEATANATNKNTCDLKKKIISLEATNKTLSTKNQQIEKKLFKFKELLRKKQASLEEMKEKVSEKIDIDTIIGHLKNELQTLRETYIFTKSKEQKMERQFCMLLQKSESLKQESHFYQTELELSKQREKRLEEQCEELEKMYYDQKQQYEAIQVQLKSTVQQQSIELCSLRQKAEQINEIQRESKSTSVYCQQISRILKKHILDVNLRKKVEKNVLQTIEELENGWNHVLIKSIANQIYKS